MKATPYLSFVEEEEELEFQRNTKSLLDFSCSLLLDNNNNNNNNNLNWIPAASISKARGGGVFFHVGASDTNKTTATTSPSPSPVAAAASSTTSTLSSSLNSGGAGGGGCSTATTQDIADPKSSCEWGTAAALPAESVVGPASPGQEQSILRLIMGDIEDPSAGLSKLLQGGGGGAGGSSHHDMEFGGGFSLMDHQIQGGLSFERQVNPFSSLFQPADSAASSVNVMSSFVPPPQLPIHHQPQQQQMIMNQNQTQFLQNPSFFGFNDRPLSPPPKRINLGSNYVLPSSVVVMKQQQQQQQQQQNDGHQQSIIDHLYKTVELIETGNAVLAQEILARLNHQLSPIGKPFYKAAFYFKEALNSSILLHTAPQPPPFNPFSVIYKIGAYKSFCEISPIVQFANFTCNQAFLEAFQGCSRVHILSFDVGFGGEWASLMQELALRNGGPPSLKITAFAAASPSAANDDLELGLTEENLKHFAWELNIALEFEVVNINCFSSPNFQLPTMSNNSNGGGEEAIAVNFPIGAFANYPSYLPRALRFLKQLSPKIVVCLDRGGCDRIDTPFPNHMIHALQSYTTLIESLEAVNSNSDALHKIERYLIQPGIEKIVSGRSTEKAMTTTTLLAWRSLIVSSGFSPLTFSNFNESQAECLVQRNLVRGFHVEKRQSSLVLCWNRKELISASAWTA